MLLADQTVQTIFGQVSPPPGMDVGAGQNPIAGLGTFIGWGINIFLTVAGLFLLLYLLWGALDWIQSAGEKEKLVKAQNKITNAVVGMVLIFAVLVVFNVLAGRILGIINVNPDGSWGIKIPTLQQSSP